MSDVGPVKQNGGWKYLALIVITLLLGGVLVLCVLFLRPNSDLVAVFGAVGLFVTLAFGQAASYLKSQETAVAVDGKMAEMTELFKKVSRLEGADEARLKEQSRVDALKAAAPIVVLATATAVPTAPQVQATPPVPAAPGVLGAELVLQVPAQDLSVDHPTEKK